MNGPIFHEFKKQASFFLKEKIKTARLALTDVTPAQIMTEEATNGNPEGPDARTLKMISKAAFEVDDYWRIVEILHRRFVRFERRDWRASYKALIVLENLLTHGPERVAEEFQSDRDVIKEMESFQLIDDKGFNWGLNVRKKSERILKLLEKGPLFKEEREKARKVSRGIQGFGSFCLKASSDQDMNQESSFKSFNRSKSELTRLTNQEDNEKTENSSIRSLNFNANVDSKENHAPIEGLGIVERELGENKPLLGEKKGKSGMKISINDRRHPFEESKLLLLSGADELQAY